MSRMLGPLFLIIFSFPPLILADELPLHERIDQLLTQNTLGPVSPICDDATFLRRVSLDLIGRIPRSHEVREFLGNSSPTKRRELVDQLLASDEYARHLATVFDVMLMERRGNKHVKTEEFRGYLESAFRENKSYRELVREILEADGTPEKNRAASAFYLERGVEPHVLTRDMGRIFYGIDLQCAQCHDHPLIDDYHQTDYYGLHAFFLRSSLFQPDKKKPALISELATGEAGFKSVFTDREGMPGPQVPGGKQLVEATLKPQLRYKTAPAKNVRAVPQASRIEALAKGVTHEPTEAFNKNIANRLWAHLFGAGMVHPFDMHHSENPPLYPDALDLIAAEFAASGYDIKFLLRELTLTNAYQRSLRIPDIDLAIAAAKESIAAGLKKKEQLGQQVNAAEEEVVKLAKSLDAAVEAAESVRTAEAEALKALEASTSKSAEAAKKTQVAQASLNEQQAKFKLLANAVAESEKAAEAYKEDKELQAALATLQKRSEARTQELQTAKENLKTLQTAADQADKEKRTQEQKTDEAIARRLPHKEKIATLRTQLMTARQTAQSLRTRRNVEQQRLAHLETLITYDELDQHIQETRVGIAKAISEEKALVSAITESTQVRKELEANLTAARQTQEKRSAERETQKLRVSEVTKSRDQLTQSHNNASLVQKTLPDDQELAKAITLLDQSLERIKQQHNLEVEKMKAAEAEFTKASKAVTEIQGRLDAVQNELKQRESTRSQMTSRLAESRQLLEEQTKEHESLWADIVRQSADRFHTSNLTPLTAEQLGLSILVATGHFDLQRASQESKLDKEKPLTEAQLRDPLQVEQREREIESATFAAYKNTLARFADLYAAGSGQPQHEFFATAEQSLFLANGGELRGWLSPSGDNLTARLQKMDDHGQLAEELYLSTLSRMPSTEETEEVQTYLNQRKEAKGEAVRELAWGLITSAEFRFKP